MPLHFAELIAVVRELGIPTERMSWRDRKYSVASEAFYREVVHPAYVAQARPYVEDAYDCEDMTDEFLQIARRAHADNPQRTEKAGLAAANIAYVPAWAPENGHNIAFLPIGKPGERKGLFYDATQQDFIRPPTAAELATIYGGPDF